MSERLQYFLVGAALRLKNGETVSLVLDNPDTFKQAVEVGNAFGVEDFERSFAARKDDIECAMVATVPVDRHPLSDNDIFKSAISRQFDQLLAKNKKSWLSKLISQIKGEEKK